MGVPVDLVGRSKDLEIADEVAGDKADEHRPGYGHHEFLADRRTEKAADGIHRNGLVNRNLRFCADRRQAYPDGG
jgi:hypothetical protein